VSGDSALYVLNRHLLARALDLGFADFKGFGPGRPLLAHAANRRLVLMPLDPAAAVPPGDPLSRPGSTALVAPTPRTPQTPLERIGPMPRPPLNGHSDEPAEASVLAADPLAECDALGGLLRDAQARLARLAQSLKVVRRQRRAFESAVSSLRQLDLS
jgi:hypothetical protein